MRVIKYLIVSLVMFFTAYQPIVPVIASSDDAGMEVIGGSVKNGDNYVYAETKEITIIFSNAIGATNGLSVKKNGLSVDFKPEIINTNCIKLIFDDEAGYDAAFSIDLTAITNESGQSCKETLSFTTETLPDISIENCSSSKSLGVFGVDFTMKNNAAVKKRAFVTVMIFGENHVVKDIEEIELELKPGDITEIQSGCYCNSLWGKCTAHIMLRDENDMPLCRTIVLTQE